MKNRLSHLALSLFVAASVMMPAAARAAESKFTLTSAVPADVFLCVSGRYNPERAFVDEYWGEIFDAAKESGVCEDVMGMITGALGEGEEVGEFNRLKDRGMQLIEDIDWDALHHGEMVFAERMSKLKHEDSNINVGPPDLLWLFRGEKAKENYTGIVNVVEVALEEITKASGEQLPPLTKSEQDGTQLAKIDFLRHEHHGLGYGLAIGQRDDMIIITLGDKILDETLALITGKSDKSIAKNDRYKSAFAELPGGEDAKVFFDMQSMLNPLKGVIAAVAQEEGGVDDVVVNAKNSGDAFDLNRQAVEEYRAGNHEKALELIQKAAETDATDSRVQYNLACFNALNGNKEAALAALTKSVDLGFYSPGQITTDGDLESLRESPEYKKALAKATEQASAHGGNDAEVIQRLGTRLLNVPGIIDYIATVEYTEGYSLHSKTLTKMVPGAEKNPFYKVITGKPDSKEFDKYLPEETKSFSVAGGFDISALYTFVKETFEAAGPDGVEAWSAWESWQNEVDFDVHKNVLDWMGGDFVSVTLDGEQGSVFMMKVKDEAVARQRVGAAVEFLSTKLVEAAADNPMLAMMSVRKSPVQNEKLNDFENLFIGMSPQPVVWGVANGHLIFSDKANAVVTCLETAEGSHAGIRKNARAMEEALIPDGDFVAVSLADQRMLGQELAAGIGMFSMMSGMMTMAIPDEQARQAIGKISGVLMKLTPVVSKIDFYKSIATVTTFDGKAWHTHAVTHYAKPDERTADAS